MAFGDYGAEVLCNGVSREDKCNCEVFEQSEPFKFSDYHPVHGVLGDGSIRVACYKQGLPTIYEFSDGTKHEVNYGSDNYNQFEYDSIHFEYKGHKFYFESSKPYYARMIEPDGTLWECYYEYGYNEL